MRFGPVSLAAAEGAILAHSCRAGGQKLEKGRILSAADLAALAAEGETEVVVARLDPGDLGEDAAAALVAGGLAAGPGLALTPAHTGRVNLKAEVPGLLAVDAAAVLALNRLDPSVTLATLPHLARVGPGTLVGTVKIITYGVAGSTARRAAAAGQGALRLLPVLRRTAGLVLSAVPGQPAKLNDKARRSIAGRLSALGIELVAVREVAHETGAMAEALADLPGEILLILTGSATSDPADDAPEAVRRAGGTVSRFGMPVDPGNLLFLGALGARPVIGLPGCARSPALNGADWVLERIACGLEIGDAEIAAMGVGGLLKEMPLRPEPRERASRAAPAATGPEGIPAESPDASPAPGAASPAVTLPAEPAPEPAADPG